MGARRIASVLLPGLAAVCLVVALATAYLRVTVLDSDQFADRAVAALDQAPVRDVVAREITDQAVLRANRDLVAVRPLVQSAAGAIVSSGPFQSLFRTAVRDLHRTLFTRDQNTATLTLADVGVLLSNALRRLDPSVARALPRDFDAVLNGGPTASEALDVADVADTLKSLSYLFGALTVVLFVAGVLVAPDRSRGVVHAGIAIAVTGGALVLAYQIARGQVVGRFGIPEDGAAAGAVWDAFLQDLRTWALVLLGTGTIIAAAAASLLRPVDVRGPLQRAWQRVVTVPSTPGRRLVRALALVAAGVLVIAERRWVLDVTLVLAGVYVLYQGVEELLRLIAERVPERPAADDEGEEDSGDGAARRRPRALLAGGLGALLIAVLIAALVGSGGTTAAAHAEITACNGHPELCDRPLNDVVLAGTHNAMSAATYPDWLFAQQEDGLGAQLRAGVRALLIDAHYGWQVGDRVLTDLDLRAERKQLVEQLGEEGVAAALRVRDRLLGGGKPRGPRTAWLCHGFCEVGSIPLTTGLREVRDYLVEHPDEVLVIVIQDEGVTPEDVAKAFDESGVRPYVYTGPVGPPWPTLRQMIESGGRVLVTAENDAGGGRVPWYHAAFELMQETPYHFTKPSEFSCAASRGPADASLFLLNHWIDTSPAPRPSNAKKVNAYQPLLDRARRCERERGLLPNVVAVDFYETGDLMRVVDTLNGIPAAP